MVILMMITMPNYNTDDDNDDNAFDNYDGTVGNVGCTGYNQREFRFTIYVY